VLNTVYFLPVLYVSFFGKPTGEWQEERPHTRFEADWLLLFPTLAVAGLVFLIGLFAGWELSPLGWAELIASRQWEGQFGN
jgi:multicomponent Na+:H+ antiporter subunit D